MFANRWNADVVEDAYQRWGRDRRSVDGGWRLFFEGFDLGMAPDSETDRAAQVGVVHLIQAYRDLGHLFAHIDPLNELPRGNAQLELKEFGLAEADLDRTFDDSSFLGLRKATLRELVAALRGTYCHTIGVEFMHVQDRTMRRWLCARMEPRRNQPAFERRKKLHILVNLHYAGLFEKFLHARYIGQKRFSLEGAETLIPMLDAVVQQAGAAGVREIVLGMAHRGRLNVLANILGKPYEEIFAEFEDTYPGAGDGDGDVKYHLGFSSDVATVAGPKVHVSLTPNPSHLEAVDPVVQGRVRAKQFLHDDRERRLGIPVLIHGDAAFAAQGVVAETLNLSQLEGYTTGGTLHIVINNQIGFTTGPAAARSTNYCTDIAKMLQVPIFHVNAEDPEAAVYVAELALAFRQEFRRDVFIDLVCYRRHGHNETDEPSFTQPVMYRQIAQRPSLTQLYTDQLLETGDLTQERANSIDHAFKKKLSDAQEKVKADEPTSRGMRGYAGRWQTMAAAYRHDYVETGVPRGTLLQISERLATLPDDFAANEKIVKALRSRHERLGDDEPIDWAFAELLAFGSLLLEGTPIRLSGQDSRRGTFSQRHAAILDTRTGAAHVPLQHLDPGQAPFHVFDSPLSEVAVLGFEYGYSLEDPGLLVLWEAQFGDFANGAQVVIDQFLLSGQTKWQRDSGLVLLLPQGYEGQGPEHSSARLERFLQGCAEDNIQVCQPTTPAQYFHMLRRQMKRGFRKPLVVMTPKSLLRHKKAVSTIADLECGGFREVLDDGDVEPDEVTRVLLCSGKVYYDLHAQRKDARDTALVPVEQFFPFASDEFERLLDRYEDADWYWVQEESQNMGGWSFMAPRLQAAGREVTYIGRDASASPAAGSHHVHEREQDELVEAAFSAKGTHLVRRLGR